MWSLSKSNTHSTHVRSCSDYLINLIMRIVPVANHVTSKTEPASLPKFKSFHHGQESRVLYPKLQRAVQNHGDITGEWRWQWNLHSSHQPENWLSHLRNFLVSLKFLQTNARRLPQIRLQLLPSTFFINHHTWSELLITSLNKQNWHFTSCEMRSYTEQDYRSETIGQNFYLDIKGMAKVEEFRELNRK